jgi:hypothetical protein
VDWFLATLEISLYSYLYPKLAKTLCLSYYVLSSLFNKIGQNRFCLEARGWMIGGGGRVAQTMYTHVNKCANDKIKRKI